VNAAQSHKHNLTTVKVIFSVFRFLCSLRCQIFK